MDIVRTILNIPTPRIYAYSASTNNSVEAEYIIMVDAPGTQLGEVWDGMEISEKARIVEDLVEMEKKLLSVSYIRFEFHREIVFKYTANLILGKSSQDYLMSTANREISWINKFAIPKPPRDIFIVSDAQNSLQDIFDIVPYILPQNEKLARPTLWRWDMHSANLFVKGSRIASLIDRQAIWAGPLFLQFRHPKLMDYNGELLLKIPATYESLEGGQEKSRLRNQVERYGNKFAADIPCPIHFIEDDLADHYWYGGGWNELADFWDSISGLVSRDGWTSNETYNQALEMFIELREEGLKNFTGEDREVFDAQTK
ncbi:hypothetical protein B7463_g11948, partial [Scytalidium lignicola]